MNRQSVNIAYKTDLGICLQARAEEALESKLLKQHVGKVDLIFTSPPFPLNRKKKYGNLQGQAYVDWLSGFASLFRKYLSPTGSIVIEVGNSWVKGEPVMSTLALRSLLEFMDKGCYELCQQFVWHNPAKLPTPAQWVNIERIRLKDAFTHLWWFSITTRPKANNRNVLVEYSKAMKHLLKSKSYNAGERPSEHRIGTSSFLRNNRGAIPSNVISIANTHSNNEYLRYCKEHDIKPHPARMPIGLPEFFIEFLTEPGDLVLDPFAGGNTTGAASQQLGRRWISVEPQESYVAGSVGWFENVLVEEQPH